MPPEFQPSSDDLARYLEQRGELTKPWNLQMLRLKKLKEAKDSMDPQLYFEKLQEQTPYLTKPPPTLAVSIWATLL